MTSSADNRLSVCLALTRAMGTTQTVEQIYDAALDALRDGLGVERASVLLFDADGVMRFKAHRRLSDTYRAAVEGHTPWRPESTDAEPIIVPDVTADPSLAPYLPTIRAEGIAAMAFVPLQSLGRVIGKFMLYSDVPREFSHNEIELAGIVAAQVAFAIERMRGVELTRRSEARLRFALDAASMGTWDWDLTTNHVEWSENLPRMHGLPDNAFDGTFASYEREIHPDDRQKVFASVERALAQGAPHEVEYRIVAPDGTIRWCEGKGRVETHNGKPVRMTGVCVMVTRRKEAELARLAAAEEASRMKDEFLATLSHELRTPLNAIMGWVQMLQTGTLPPDKAQHATEVIARNAKLQAQLIEDILDVSRIITGQLNLDREPVLLQQLVDAVITSVAPAALAKQITIVNGVPADLPSTSGDPQRLQQVLANVVSNAVKFTPASGRVDVTAETDDLSVTVRVTDSGIGIDPAFLPHIFDRFRQADSTTTRRHGGLGLGLAIARHLIEEHGGTIRAESAGRDSGTTIIMRLPRDVNSAATPGRLATKAAEISAPLSGKRVVVIDDERDSRELLASILERHGAVVTPCDHAAAVIAAVEGGFIDLLVADIAMPDVDGYRLLELVRRQAPLLPAVAVSAYARPEDRAKALSSGFAAYCVKPLEASLFLDAVALALNAPASHPPAADRTATLSPAEQH